MLAAYMPSISHCMNVRIPNCELVAEGEWSIEGPCTANAANDDGQENLTG